MSNQVKLDFDKMGGLLPAIVQGAATGDVLMLAFMNRRRDAPWPPASPLLQPHRGDDLAQGGTSATCGQEIFWIATGTRCS
jgi:hypothetical protein